MRSGVRGLLSVRRLLGEFALYDADINLSQSDVDRLRITCGTLGNRLLETKRVDSLAETL